jgi:uncharacterized glyoxalase superfamily protein PhnB
VTAYPVLHYRDARGAIAWLGEAFAFTPVNVYDGPGDTVAHAELRAGKGIVMFGSVKDEAGAAHVGRSQAYVAVEDPDALHARAVAAGAEIVMGLTDTDHGSRDFSARDVEGNLWSFGTYAPQ